MKINNILILFVALMLSLCVGQTSVQAASAPVVNIQSMIARSDSAINQRLSSLNSLVTRVSAMQKLSDAQKTTLTTSLQSQISSLTKLKTTIDSDTTTSALRVDMQSITKSYRIYALILPQANISAASDRVLTIVGLMTPLQAKLQSRIAQIKNPSSLVTLAMSDITGKLNDASAEANGAATEISSLTPDQGNTKIAASNTLALKDARDKIKTAMSDLQSARKDFATITQGIKSSSQ